MSNVRKVAQLATYGEPGLMLYANSHKNLRAVVADEGQLVYLDYDGYRGIFKKSLEDLSEEHAYDPFNFMLVPFTTGSDCSEGAWVRIDPVGVWSSSITYNVDSVVWYKGEIYISETAGNTNNPETLTNWVRWPNDIQLTVTYNDAEVDTVALTWNEDFTDEVIEVVIYRSTESFSTANLPEALDTVEGGIGSFQDADFENETTYFYMVDVRTVDGSNYSKVIDVTTLFQLEWSPSSLDLALWLEADQGVTSSSGVLTGWENLAEDTRSVNIIGQPLVEEVNGVAGIYFDGVDDYAYTTKDDLQFNESKLVAVAATMLSDGELFVGTRVDYSSGATGWMLRAQDGTAVYSNVGSGAGGVNSNTTDLEIVDTVILIGYNVDGKFKLTFNGVSAGEVSGVSGLATSEDYLWIMTQGSQGSVAGTQYYGDSYLHNVIVSKGVHTTNDIVQLEGYLATELDRLDLLPSDHYANTGTPYVVLSSTEISMGAEFTLETVGIGTATLLEIEIGETVYDILGYADTSTTDITVDLSEAGLPEGTAVIRVGDGSSTIETAVELTDFSPLDLSPALWLDASDTDTIVLDENGNIEQWLDKSENSVSVTQTTEADRPYTNTVDGHTAVVVELGDHLDYDGSILVGTEYTLVVVGSRASSSADYFLGGSATSTTNGNLQFGWRNGDEYRLAHWSNDLEATGEATDGSSLSIHIGVQRSTERELFLDGVSVGSDSNTSLLVSYTGAMIGRYQDKVDSSVRIHELLIFDYALSESELEGVQSYLSSKFS